MGSFGSIFKYSKWLIGNKLITACAEYRFSQLKFCYLLLQTTLPIVTAIPIIKALILTTTTPIPDAVNTNYCNANTN